MQTNYHSYSKMTWSTIFVLTSIQCFISYFVETAPLVFYSFIIPFYHFQAQALLFPFLWVTFYLLDQILVKYRQLLFYFLHQEKTKWSPHKIILVMIICSALFYDPIHSIYGIQIKQLLVPFFKDHSLIPIIQKTGSESVGFFLSMGASFLYLIGYYLLHETAKDQDSDQHHSYIIILATALAISPLLLSIIPTWSLLTQVFPIQLLRDLVIIFSCILIMYYLRHLTTMRGTDHRSTLIKSVLIPYLSATSLFYLFPHWVDQASLSSIHLLKSCLHTLSDQDGDQASTWFDHDCNDDDASIFPQAVDWPNDGIDQNCDGVDASNTDQSQTDYLSFPQAIYETHTLPTKITSQWKAPQHIILITIDTLRADYVNSSPPFPIKIPALRQLQKQGIDFTHAYTPAFITRHAIPSILGGRFFNQLQKQRAGLAVKDTPYMSHLFKTLKSHNYQTHAHLPSYLNQYWPDQSQVFDQVHTYASPYHLKDPHTAHSITAGVLKQWKQTNLTRTKTATWIHWVEPHAPYVCHHQAYGTHDQGCYASEIEKVDQSLSQLIDYIKSKQQWSTTWWALTSDHGEEFLEHGGRFHGKTLFEESIRIPLVVVDPNLPPRKVSTPVNAVHLSSWLTHLLHEYTQTPSTSKLAYHPWNQLLFDQVLSPHMIWVDGIQHNDQPQARQIALIQYPWKTIYHWKHNQIRLYHLPTDPQEKHSLHQEKPKQANHFKKVIHQAIKQEALWEMQSIQSHQTKPLSMIDSEKCHTIDHGVSLCNFKMELTSLPSKKLLNIQWYYQKHASLSDSFKIKLQVFAISKATLKEYRMYQKSKHGDQDQLHKKIKKSRAIHTRSYLSFAGRYPSHLWPTEKYLLDELQINVNRRMKAICTYMSIQFSTHTTDEILIDCLSQ